MVCVFFDPDLSQSTLSKPSSIFHCSHQFLGRRNLNPVPPSAAQDRSSNSVQLRSPVLLNVLLHRAAHVCGHAHHPQKALSRHQPSRPRPRQRRTPRARKPRPDSSTADRQKLRRLVLSAAVVLNAKGARKTSLPHIRVGSSSMKPARKANLLKLIDSARQATPVRRTTHSAGQKEMRWTMWPGLTRSSLARNRSRDHTLCAVASAQHSNVVNAIQQWNNGSHRIRIL